MIRPKISVIIPCYKVEKYLDRCIKSVIEQTLKELEIILVDDESPDRVPEMCDGWTSKDPRIKVVHKKNGGLGIACNSGIKVATGKYVAFLDSDDWIDADMYQTMYDIAEKYQAQMVFTGLKRVDEKGRVSTMPHPSKQKIYKRKDELLSLMLDIIASEPEDPVERHIQMSAKTVLYNLDFLKCCNICFESERKFISEDLLFNLDCLNKSNCAVVLPYLYYNYFINSFSLTSMARPDRFEKYCLIRDELLRRYNNLASNREYKNRVNRMFIGYCRTIIERICKDKYISTVSKWNLLLTICKNKLWRNIGEEYPVHRMPIKHKVLFKAILYKQVAFIQLIYLLKRK